MSSLSLGRGWRPRPVQMKQKHRMLVLMPQRQVRLGQTRHQRGCSAADWCQTLVCSPQRLVCWIQTDLLMMKHLQN